MKIQWLFLFFVLLCSCHSAKKDIDIIVHKNQIILQNWTPKTSLSSYQEGTKLYVWDAEKKQVNHPPIAGELVQLKNRTIAYRPLFPLTEHTQYLLSVRTTRHDFEQIVEWRRGKTASPFVTSIYPTQDTLPENLLRMYIVFSQPMKTVGNLERIKLIDEHGQEVIGAIFNNVYELWDTEQRQLTIIFDPARVKTGLKANETMGRALQVGHQYTLVVDGLEDIHGQKLAQPFTKTIYVAHEDVTAPNTDQWTLTTPTAQSHAPLSVQFPAMIDRLSLFQRLKLTDRNGTAINGRIAIGKHEMEWIFTPDEAWEAGQYSIHINSRLEDPAGNNLNGLFDHDIGSLLNEKEGAIIRLTFQIAD